MKIHANGTVETHFRAKLPAHGKTILGDEAIALLCRSLPDAMTAALQAPRSDTEALIRHIKTVEDAQTIRTHLTQLGLITFIADGAVLPRRSGIDDRPLIEPAVVPFRSPNSLQVRIETPNDGTVAGMDVPEGVTLLVGKKFHGKSTLLQTIQHDVYDHLPEDGHEFVITRADAVKIRAEDKRTVHNTDISNFIENLPRGEDTRRFFTRNASGSTSQTADIVETIELGCGCLLLNEDTSATNFLIRDAHMQTLIERSAEPITPFIDHVHDLRSRNVSLVLIVGGSSNYFNHADTVIAMRAYVPRDVTTEAHALVDAIPTQRTSESRPWHDVSPRSSSPDRIRPQRGPRDVMIKVFSPHRLAFGTAELDLSAIEQLVESAQTHAIARALAWARETCIDGQRPIADSMNCVMRALEGKSLDSIDDRRLGKYAEFRIFELAAVLNRFRMTNDDQGTRRRPI